MNGTPVGEAPSVGHSVAANEFAQAKRLVDSTEYEREDKIETLLEIADGLVSKPKTAEEILHAVELYDLAYALCLATEDIVQARILVRKGMALRQVPSETSETLIASRQALQMAFPVLEAFGETFEVADLHFNLGLVMQALAQANKCAITDAIAEYQHALRYFQKEHYPSEFALIHNNLATAFLSIPATDERSKIREALAVQSFEAALEVVTLIDHPSEYAMLQNNLGNALQYSSSAHPIENNLRAIEAYNESLKVRTRNDAPIEYANTVCNKANCLLNLPDDAMQIDQLEHTGSAKGSHHNQQRARALYQEAIDIFLTHGETTKVELIRQALEELDKSRLSQHSTTLEVHH